ncbi:hypothetical protein AAF712_016555, partial [Marasmius tenuissimus]
LGKMTMTSALCPLPLEKRVHFTPTTRRECTTSFSPDFWVTRNTIAPHEHTKI